MTTYFNFFRQNIHLFTNNNESFFIMKSLINITALKEKLRVRLEASQKVDKPQETLRPNNIIDPASRPVDMMYIATPLEEELYSQFRDED